MDLKHIALDPLTAENTVLDTGSEGDSPISWEGINPTAGLLQMTDDIESTESESNSKRPISNRSPNRDDSDSEDDTFEEKNGKSIKFDPSSDIQFNTHGFKTGFAEDRNKRFRRTMEDSHSILYDFNNECGTGFFAVFDGHAGRAAADYAGENLHQKFSYLLNLYPMESPSFLLNQAFLALDKELATKKGLNSGCTVAVAYIRYEVRNGIRKRILYTANVGDARTVLSRNWNAIRLSYDHKGSDIAESERIIQTGGFMMNNRVNGVLAVTRSLGDLTMKEWVIGSPYTTETILTEFDTNIIIACDGVY